MIGGCGCSDRVAYYTLWWARRGRWLSQPATATTPVDLVSGDPHAAAVEVRLSRESRAIRTEAAATATIIISHITSLVIICSLLANDMVFAGFFEPPVIYAYLTSKTLDSFLRNTSHYEKWPKLTNSAIERVFFRL